MQEKISQLLMLTTGKKIEWILGDRFAFSVFTLLSFVIFKLLILNNFDDPLLRGGFYFVAALFACYFSSTNYCRWSSSSRIIVSVVSLLFGLYHLFSIPILIESDSLFTKFELGIYKYIAFVAAVISLWRPSFIIVPVLYMVQSKVATSDLLEVSISQTDYSPLVEGVLFIYIGMFYSLYNKDKEDKEKSQKRSELLFLITVAAHFSNYFYSGIKKIWISDGSLTWWALNNNTDSLILTALKSGHLPLAFGDEFIQQLYEYTELIVPYSNTALFLGQIFAFVAILNIKWIKRFTLFYDLTHIGIYLLTGIFFYKWIIYNFALIYASSKINYKFDVKLKVCLMAMVFSAPLFFFTAKLGWFDNRSFNHEYVEAEFKDGTHLEVPSNYFLSASVTHAQQRVIRHKGDGFYPSGTFGVTFGVENSISGENCDYELDLNVGIDDYADELDRVARRLDRLHEFYLANEIENVFNYDLYPHHIFSTPWLYEDFKSRYKKDIVKYSYVIESYCLAELGDISSNRLDRRVEVPVYEVN